tara:strand:+ start:449 stop:898 length:450 start_codon:yes stop_codon:yes gene_type:complete
MVQRLDHYNRAISEKIHTVFQASYAVEAKLLDAIEFPPLQRSIDHLVQSQTEFYGIGKADGLSAVIEIKVKVDSVHIQSLVVDPDYFRRGMAKMLVAFVLQTHTTNSFTVETGVANLPAIALYKSFAFVETHQYDTDHGIRKVHFVKMV